MKTEHASPLRPSRRPRTLAIKQNERGTPQPQHDSLMKKCTYCGLENPDDAIICSTCHTEFAMSKPPQPPVDYLISTQEQRYWARMTFRQFAVLIIRLQALWLFFDAVDDATYLPSYIRQFTLERSFTHASPTLQMTSSMLVLRIGLHVLVGFALIFNAENFLSWMVKDLAQQQPPELAPKTTA